MVDTVDIRHVSGNEYVALLHIDNGTVVPIVHHCDSLFVAQMTTFDILKEIASDGLDAFLANINDDIPTDLL